MQKRNETRRGAYMRYLSICSGIEAASVAWHDLGWTPVGFSEIEPFPSAVLAHRFPSVPNLGDMNGYSSWPIDRTAIDLLVGGTPCQAFSVAGKREGLADERGNLTLTFCEIADHFDPDWIVWENVPGVLTSKDNAFGCFLGRLAGEDCALEPAGGKWADAGCVFGPERAIAWRILDAQYFGVAQRRRRVFVVASARDGFDPAAVLFEFDGVRRDTPPSREAGQGAATGAGSGAARGSWWDGGQVSQTLDAVLSKGQTMPEKNRFPAVLQPVSVHGTEDPDIRFDHAHTLGRNSGQENAVLSVALRGRDGGATAELGDDVSGCLRASSGGGDKPHVMTPVAIPIHDQATRFAGKRGDQQDGKGNGLGVGRDGDPAPTLTKGDKHAVAYSADPVCITGDITHTLKAEGFDASEDGTGRGQPIVAAPCPVNTQMATRGAETSNTSREGIGVGVPGDPAFTLQAAHCHAVQTGMAVRRLTPVECERLQGFPDGWTDVPYRGKPAADGPRYKALGNSMAVPCMAWIGRRIAAVAGG